MSLRAASASAPRHSARQLAEIARRWGYDYEVPPATDARRPAKDEATEDEPILLEGLLRTDELRCGVKLCASDLVATRDSARVGLLQPSLIVIFMLDGDAARYRLGAGEELQLGCGHAAVVTADEGARLAGHYRRDQHCRSLVLQVRPGDVDDDDLATQLDATLCRTAMTPVVLGARLRGLAEELFASGSTGVVGRLLAESCALELLARGLSASLSAGATAAATQHPQDVVRMLRVRDKLVAEADREHHLADLARLAGVSVSTLKTKFPAVVGRTVFDFLRDQRLELARRGLESEGWTVKQAAYFAGYRHPTNFTAAYRRKFGMPPSDTPRQ